MQLKLLGKTMHCWIWEITRCPCDHCWSRLYCRNSPANQRHLVPANQQPADTITHPQIYLLIYLIYGSHTHAQSFTVTVNNRISVGTLSVCRKARLYKADLSLFLNVPVAASPKLKNDLQSSKLIWGKLKLTA